MNYYFPIFSQNIQYTNIQIKMSEKGRKQSIANILDKEETFAASSSRRIAYSRRNRSNRSISIIDEEDTPSTSRLVRCDCTECNGRTVDPRTKVLHESRDRGSQVTVPTAFSEPESRNQGS